MRHFWVAFFDGISISMKSPCTFTFCAFVTISRSIERRQQRRWRSFPAITSSPRWLHSICFDTFAQRLLQGAQCNAMIRFGWRLLQFIRFLCYFCSFHSSLSSLMIYKSLFNYSVTLLRQSLLKFFSFSCSPTTLLFPLYNFSVISLLFVTL